MSDDTQGFGHVPVMLNDTLAYLVPPRPDCLMIDGTLGLAGHSSAFLSRYGELRLLGVDADAQVQAMARARLSLFGERASFYNGYFDEFFLDYAGRVERGEAERPALVLFDFGVSMFHFRESGRGFSLQGDEALDMRLSPRAGRTAAELVNGLGERELFGLLRDFGEEPSAFRIAQALVRERRAAPIETTARLADIVRGAVPAAARHGRIHPATRTFQALRIAVNDELGRIERALGAAIEALEPGGLIACISFHSLEDRIVKLAFRAKAAPRERVRYTREAESPIPEGEAERRLVVITKKPVEPADDEVAANPASRSAKLRVARAVGGRS